MVTFTNNLQRLPIDTNNIAENDLNRWRNDQIDTRLETLRLQYDAMVPQELETRFLIDGRITSAGIDDMIITPMDNVSDVLWNRIQSEGLFF